MKGPRPKPFNVGPTTPVRDKAQAASGRDSSAFAPRLVLTPDNDVTVAQEQQSASGSVANKAAAGDSGSTPDGDARITEVEAEALLDGAKGSGTDRGTASFNDRARYHNDAIEELADG